MTDPQRVLAASTRFKTFFTELSLQFVEREALLQQIALGLLCREHVLVAGPPGTAKSQIASATLGRIVDESTGRPSLYARQFTENTVQTDLVGPINFKTLMETGRTEHFTDEGMLGAVHAFLDEVFDGRDMLLRSALNVLQERELKEGTKTTRGRIECAVMTSNRYLAEILESARDTLLAFVDRIAFLSFVPKGFVDPTTLSTIVRKQAGGVARPQLDASLTVQDLDALQEAADGVFISDAACDALVVLVRALDMELAAAAKADPSFVATRYMSTRTVVRSAKVLRAIVHFDRIFRNPDRPLEVLSKDFEWLRLHLVLSGPDPAGVQVLMSRETDPRERRQLSIVRTEREIFDRCLALVPKFEPTARPQRVDVTRLRAMVESALPGDDSGALGKAARAVAQAAASGATNATDAAVLLEETLAALSERAVRRGLTAGTGEERTAEQIVDELCTVADQIEQTATAMRPTARWLRGRALRLIDGLLEHVPILAGDLGALTDASMSRAAIVTAATTRVESLAHVHALRQRILAAGALVDDVVAVDAAWQRIVARAEDDLGTLYDAAFRRDVEAALRDVRSDKLADVLRRLSDVLAAVREANDRLGLLRGGSSRLNARVVGGRIGPLVATAFARLSARDRAALVREVDALLGSLANAGLAGVLDAGSLVAWTADALLRSGDTETPAPSVVQLEEYRAFRSAEQRVPLAYTLVEVALRVAPEVSRGTDAALAAGGAIRALLERLPADLRARLVQFDVARIGRSVAVLEAWWERIVGPGGDAERVDPARAATVLAELSALRFLVAVRDEAALARFSLEARLIAEMFPAHAASAEQMRARIEAFDARIQSTVHALATTGSDAAWIAALAVRA